MGRRFESCRARQYFKILSVSTQRIGVRRAESIGASGISKIGVRLLERFGFVARFDVPDELRNGAVF